jgi:hypothetical protein
MGELAILHFQMIIIFPMGARRSIYNPMDNKRQGIFVANNQTKWHMVVSLT